ncbi:Na(+)-translocating NADH-quinone reductase subunit C [Planctomycetota bacterium]
MQDSAFKTIGVATGICLFCSLFVSVAAVKLKPRQVQNKQLDKVKNILQVAGLADKNTDLMAVYEERIQSELIELSTGQPVSEDQFNEILNPNSFDIQVMSGLPEYSQAIPGDQDITGIKRQPLQMVVYKLVENGQVEKLILPLYGKGLWSTMYAFLALEKDLQTVSGLTFYQHGETPGLGGEVDNPNWKDSWQGKQAFNNNGDIVIQVVKGQVDPGSANAGHQIDGLSGATLTTRGIDNLIQYWLGEHGYGPYLQRLREER